MENKELKMLVEDTRMTTNGQITRYDLGNDSKVSTRGNILMSEGRILTNLNPGWLRRFFMKYVF